MTRPDYQYRLWNEDMREFTFGSLPSGGELCGFGTDKTGDLIYEGDIIKMSDGSILLLEWTDKVIYGGRTKGDPIFTSPKLAGFSWRVIYNKEGKRASPNLFIHYQPKSMDMEIIGNRQENPELL